MMQVEAQTKRDSEAIPRRRDPWGKFEERPLRGASSPFSNRRTRGPRPGSCSGKVRTLEYLGGVRIGGNVGPPIWTRTPPMAVIIEPSPTKPASSQKIGSGPESQLPRAQPQTAVFADRPL